MSINLTDELNAATKKGKIAAAKQVFLDGDSQNVQKEIEDINARHDTLSSKHDGLNATVSEHTTQIANNQSQITANKSAQDAKNASLDSNMAKLNTRDDQITELVKGVTATGGASVATAVSYDNASSNLDAATAQGAIDELATKKLNKTDIVQELGDAEDKVVSQFALPFREIESPEFIKVIVDANDHLLFTINLDGEVDWSNGIPAPIRVKLQEIVSQCQQDKTDILEAVNAAKEELSASITALQEGKVNKEEGKSLIEDEVKECFRIIENEEFLKAIVDSDDKVLFGIYRATGKPYYPLNEMYHVIQNEEYFAAWVTTDDKVVLGLRRDGQIIGEIHAANALKQVISQLQSDLASLQEKVGTIDTNLKELLDVFSLQENPEYLAVEKDAEGKVLAATYNDGSHYSHNLKSETIDAKVDKEEGMSLINSDVAEAQSTIEDPEGRMEFTTDADGKVLSERKQDGEKHEVKMTIDNLKVSNLNLQGNSVNNIQDALKANGFDVKTPIDWSDSEYVQMPEPRCARVNLITSTMPTAKSGMGTSGVNCDIPCKMEFWDMQGNYFKIPILLSAQGNSSMAFIKKNLAIDMFTDEERSNSFVTKFGDWVSQDSYHLKAYFTDFFRGVGAVGYMLYEEIMKTRDIGSDRPYKDAFSGKWDVYDNGIDSIEDLDKNMDTGAKCFPMGFPVIVYQNGEFYGVYSWQLKKHRDNMHQDKKTAEHIHLDGTLGEASIFGGKIDWTQFEVRNPKNLYMQEKHTIKGEETLSYNGDYPFEIMGEDSELYNASDKNMKRCATVKKYIVNLSGRISELKQAEAASKSTEEIKALIEKYFNVSFMIDYILFTNLIGDGDGFNKNWQWTTYDGIQWCANPYDLDGSYGAYHLGNYVSSPYRGWVSSCEKLEIPTGWIIKYYMTELEARWAELRKDGVFDAKHIAKLLQDWCSRIGYDNWESEYDKWNESPCNRPNNTDTAHWVRSVGYTTTWSMAVTYNTDKLVSRNGKAYKSLVDSNVGIDPSTDDGTHWEDVTYVSDKEYAVGDVCYYGSSVFYGFKCAEACIGQAPITSFYNTYPRELGHFDSIYRVENWLQKRIEYLDTLLDYTI